ncbi:MAG: hypothetical protein ACLGIS_05030 [Actinomycetes bacterium]
MTRDIVHQGLATGQREASYPLVEDPVKRHNPRLSGDNGRIQHVIVDTANTPARQRIPLCSSPRTLAAKKK